LGAQYPLFCLVAQRLFPFILDEGAANATV